MEVGRGKAGGRGGDFARKMSGKFDGDTGDKRNGNGKSGGGAVARRKRRGK